MLILERLNTNPIPNPMIINKDIKINNKNFTIQKGIENMKTMNFIMVYEFINILQRYANIILYVQN